MGLFQKDTPIDEKRISLIETVVSRLALKVHKRAHALITPFPISGAMFGDSVKGSILRYMFPCEGTIVKGAIRLGAKPKVGVKLVVDLLTQTGWSTRDFTIESQILVVEPNVSVVAGDCLDISIDPAESEIVTEIWVSFLWIPTTKDVEVKSFLISEIQNALLEESQELTGQ